MKEGIECEIINDLLPNYIDGIVSEETNELIRNHIRSCPKCKEQLTLMNTDLKIKTDYSTHIDFLKKVHTKSRNLLILFFIINCFLLLFSTFLSSRGSDESPVFVCSLYLMIMLLIFIRFALPLFCGISCFFMYRKNGKKKWLTYTSVFSLWYITSIVLYIHNIFAVY